MPSSGCSAWSRPAMPSRSSMRASPPRGHRRRNGWPMPSRPPAGPSGSSRRRRRARWRAGSKAEARERGLALGPGTAKTLAERVGGFVREGDTERTYQTRLASMELDKLALYRGGEPIRPEDVEALVAEAVPGSVWAFTDAIGERRVERALGWLDRLFDSTAEPILLAVLHRRIRELIETGDRLAAGERLAAIGRAMGIASEFRMEKLRDQARLWTTAELVAALDGLVELDAMVKGMPGARAERRAAAARVQPVGDGPRRSRPATGRLTVSRRTTRPAPGRRGRSRWRRRSGPRPGRAAR